MKTEGKTARWLERAGEEYDNELEQVKSFHHSTFYHRFFEGYSEVRVKKEGTKHNTIKRQYVGAYYRQDCSERSWIFQKIWYVLLFALAVCLFGYGLSRPTAGNSAWYGALSGFLCIIALVFLMVRVLECACKKRKMTIYEYRSSFGGLFRQSVICAALLLLGALCSLVGEAAGGQPDPAGLIPCACCLAAAVFIGIIGFTERGHRYEELENGAEGFDDGVTIG